MSLSSRMSLMSHVYRGCADACLALASVPAVCGRTAGLGLRGGRVPSRGLAVRRGAPRVPRVWVGGRHVEISGGAREARRGGEPMSKSTVTVRPMPALGKGVQRLELDLSL